MIVTTEQVAAALTALTQIATHLARIATALEDRPAPSPLDALRAAHPDWTWTPQERGDMGTVYEGDMGNADVSHDYIIVRCERARWAATKWHGLVEQATREAPTPDGAVALLLGTATAHTFTYRNHEGVTRAVRVLDGTQSLTVEPTDHYPHGGLKVRAWDVDRNDWRVYDMARVGG